MITATETAMLTIKSTINAGELRKIPRVFVAGACSCGLLFGAASSALDGVVGRRRLLINGRVKISPNRLGKTKTE